MDSIATAFDAHPVPTALLTAGRWAYVNPAFAALVGSDGCERPPLELVAPDEREAVAHWYRGKPGVHATRWRRADGTEVTVEVSMRALDDQGTASFVIAVNDLSAREMLSQRLRKSEDSFRAVVDASPDPMFVYAAADDLYTVLWANAAMVRLLGYDDAAQIIGRPTIASFVHPDDRAGLWKFRRQGGEGGYPLRWVTSDGRVVYVVGTRRAVRFGEVDAFVVIARDRTEELARERDRQAAEAAVRESETRYRMLFDGSPLPVWLFDAETFRYLAVNDKMVELYGYSREEFAAMTVKDVKPPEDVSAMVTSLREAPPGTHKYVGIRRHRRKDGTVLELDITSHQVLVDGRKCSLAIAVDMTERRRIEDQLRQSQKMEAIGQLAGGVAHDFNNLLAVILSTSEFVREEIGPGHELAGDIVDIEAAAKRAAALTRQLLAFSRKQPHTPQIVCLRAVVEDIEKMLRRVVREDIELTTSLATVGQVEIDRGQIEQVILNLVVNARDAMPRGGKLSIETGGVVLDEIDAACIGVTPGAYVTLAVSDNGCGMDEATKRRIFEPFFTTKEVGAGTGLGLATVFGIVRQAGGSVSVRSEVGRGATFRVYLPRVDHHSSIEVQPAELVMAGGSESILVVEDDPQLRAVIHRRLGALGYEITTARDAGSAVAALAGARIDLLLTDLVMPGMDGRALATTLLERLPGLKVLFMSGYSEHAAVKTAALGPDDHFIAKPFTVGGLSMAVRRALQTM